MGCINNKLLLRFQKHIYLTVYDCYGHTTEKVDKVNEKTISICFDVERGKVFFVLNMGLHI